MRRVILAVFATVAGLVGLLSFKTHPEKLANPAAVVGTAVPGASGSTAGTTTTDGSSSTTPATSAARTASAASKTPATPAAASTTAARATTKATTKTVTGNSADTRWGPVQVRIVVTNGKLTGVTAVDYPQNNGRDQQINATAIPELNAEALAAGSAQIDMVSGATYTSQGYLASLQSALDKAGL